MEKTVMIVILIFVLNFKFTGGLIAQKQLGKKEASCQESFGCENQGHYKQQAKTIAQDGIVKCLTT